MKLERWGLSQIKHHCLKVLKEFLFKKNAAGAEQERNWSKYFDVGAEQEQERNQIKNLSAPIPCLLLVNFQFHQCVNHTEVVSHNPDEKRLESSQFA